jgi:hypothetical protein
MALHMLYHVETPVGPQVLAVGSCVSRSEMDPWLSTTKRRRHFICNKMQCGSPCYF